MNGLKEYLKKNSIIGNLFAFNVYKRDRWVEQESKSIPKGMSILDVGAGSSPYRDYFSHCNYQTHDFSQLKDEQLRGLGYAKIDIVSDINNIPVSNESFDIIICTEVFEHIPEPIKALSEISRILKKGGKLLLTAPLGSGLHQEPFHFYGGYTPYWYEKFLKDNNFESIKILPNQGYFSFFSQEFLRFIKRSAPWKSVVTFIFVPFWVSLLPFSIIISIIAPLLDKFTTYPDYTVGYHVTAIKK